MIEQFKIPELKGKQKTIVKIVKDMMYAERSRKIMEQQKHYDKLYNYCEKNNIDFINALKGAKEYIRKYDIAMNLNGYVSY